MAFVVPDNKLLICFYTSHLQNTIADWSYVFLIGSVVYIVPAIVFMLFGSAQVQPWNDPEMMVANDNNNKGGNNAPDKVESIAIDKPTVTRL